MVASWKRKSGGCQRPGLHFETECDDTLSRVDVFQQYNPKPKKLRSGLLNTREHDMSPGSTEGYHETKFRYLAPLTLTP